jgi:hypothetical protein
VLEAGARVAGAAVQLGERAAKAAKEIADGAAAVDRFQDQEPDAFHLPRERVPRHPEGLRLGQRPQSLRLARKHVLGHPGAVLDKTVRAVREAHQRRLVDRAAAHRRRGDDRDLGADVVRDRSGDGALELRVHELR